MASLATTQRLLEAGIAAGLQRGAQVYVSRGRSGQTREIHELALGKADDDREMTVDTLNIWLSSTKPISAAIWALVWERGLCDLDDRVAAIVPEFGARGKEEITIRHLLTHTSAIRMLNVGWPEAGWDQIIATICAQKPEPRFKPGQVAGYHLSSSWFILGELVQRLIARPFSEFARAELFERLGMVDSFIGMPRESFHALSARIGRVWSTENGEIARNWHSEPHVVGCSPGGNGYGPMRELGLFYEMLLRRGRTPGGEMLLRPQTVEALTAPQRVGMVDLTFQTKLDWGLGFIVDSKHYGADRPIPYGYGPHASRRTFGHSGFQSSTGFADPENDLVVALFVNGQPGDRRHNERFDSLLAAVYEDLGLASPAQSSPSSMPMT